MSDITIKHICRPETALLEKFLYEAIFQEQDKIKLPYEIIYKPEIYIYVKDFGRKDDYLLAAESNNEIVGCVWVRIIDAYGHIDDNTPEFAISVLLQFRGRGIGSKLMRAMIEYLKKSGYAKASLSVDKKNYAVKMYQSLGFYILDENKHDYKMVLDLDQSNLTKTQ